MKRTIANDIDSLRMPIGLFMMLVVRYTG